MSERGAPKESWSTWFFRLGINLYPSYRGSGGRVKYIAPDWLEIRMELPLNWRTKNNAGTIFGGSLYSAIDPFYALMVAKNLGKEFVIWDKAASIRYRRPGDGRLYARFVLTKEEIEGIRNEMEHRKSTDRVYTVELVDWTGDVKTRIEKTIYIGWRDKSRFDAVDGERKPASGQVAKDKVVSEKEAG